MTNSRVTAAPDNPRIQLLQINENTAGQRIDNYLMARLKGAPRSLIYRIVRKGEVRVNKGRIRPEYKLQAGDLVRIPPVRLAAATSPQKPGTNLIQLLNNAVVYEDDALLVINKPSGLAAHGGSGITLGLIESLRQIRPDDHFLELVHRLDRGTSGCVMVARNRQCLRYLQNQLRENRIHKFYRALVCGHWPKRRQCIQVALLKRQAVNGERIVRAVDESVAGAKTSRTDYKIITRYKTCTLLEAKPVTGRTHQIRVHCQYVGHSILGDEKYGQREQHLLLRELGLQRLFLHACKLEFADMNGRRICIKAPLDNTLETVLGKLTIDSAG